MFISRNKDVVLTASSILHGTFPSVHLMAFTVHTKQAYSFKFEVYVLVLTIMSL